MPPFVNVLKGAVDYQRGAGSSVQVSRVALRELLEDWELLDKQVRSQADDIRRLESEKSF